MFQWGLAPGSEPNENDSPISLAGQAIGTVLAANQAVQSYPAGMIMEESGVLYKQGVMVEVMAVTQAAGASLNASKLIGIYLSKGTPVPEGSPLDKARGTGGSQDVEVKLAPTQQSEVPKASDLKKLSKGEIKRLKKGGIDVHELKADKSASRFDLFKDKQGNIYVLPKKGKGEPDPTGLNVKDFQ